MNANTLTPTLTSTLMILFATACGGPEDASSVTEDALRPGDSFSQGVTASCGDVCTGDVAACCICKCYEDFSWPASTACAVGCAVIAAADAPDWDEEEDTSLAFKAPDGSPVLSIALLADADSGYDVPIDLGFRTLRTGAWTDRDVAELELSVVPLDEYLEAAAANRKPAVTATRHSRDRDGRYTTSIDARRMPSGPYVLLVSAGGYATLATLEVR